MGLRDRSKKASQTDSNFIGRQNILDDFATEWKKQIDENPRFIVNLHGIGGIGKSRLLKRLLFEHKQNNIVCKLDANFDSIADPINILKTILDKTRYNDEPIEFKETRKLVVRFDSLVQDAAKAGGNFSVSAISRFLVKGAQIGGELIGGTETGKIVGELGNTVAESGVVDYIDAVLKSAKNEQDNKLLQAPLREITAKLVQEIDKEIGENTKFILIIDTYEKVSHDIDQWLLRDLLGEPVTGIDFDLRLIIAGREPLKERNWHWYDEWGNALLLVPVEPFTIEETREFLVQSRNIHDPKLVEIIHNRTGGYPFWLDLWANSDLDAEAFFSASHLQKIEERLFEMFPDPKHKDWLRKAAIFRRFNQELITILIDDEAEAATDWLIHQSSLVESDGKLWKLHDISRQIILTNLYARSRNLLSAPAAKILAYYNQQLKSSWENWRDLKLSIKFSYHPEEKILTEISYYNALSSGNISNDHLDMILRISDKSYQTANVILINSLQALSDIDAKFTKKALFAVQLLSALSSGVTEKKSEEFRKHLQTCTYSHYQRAILFNRIAELYRDKLKQLEKAKEYFEESLTIEPEYESALFNCCRLIFTSEPENAMEMIRKILVHNPNYPDVFFMHGYCKSMMNCHEEAIEQYHKVVEINPEYVSAHINWGASLASLGRYKEAIECYEKAIKIDPKHATAYFNWGISLSRLGRDEEAIQQYEKAVDINPEYASAYFNWGISLARLGRDKEAIQQYKKAIKIDPENSSIHNNWGISLARLGRDEEAIQQYKKAVDIDPEYTLAHNNWGISLSQLGRDEEAIQQYEKAVEINPEDVSAYFNWGFSLARLGRDEEAIQQYEKAVENNLENAVVYFYRGISFARLGRDEEAIQQYEKAVKFNPKDASTYSAWGVSLAEIGRNEEAIQQYEKAVKFNPKDASTYSAWGDSLVKLGRGKEAIKQYQKAVKINPEVAIYWGSMGFYYYMLKNYPKSIEASRKGIEIDDKAFWIYCNLALALLHNEQWEKSKDTYQEVIQIIISGEYSDTDYKENKKKLLQEKTLDDLYDARKEASAKLLDRINEIIDMLEQAKEKF